MLRCLPGVAGAVALGAGLGLRSGTHTHRSQTRGHKNDDPDRPDSLTSVLRGRRGRRTPRQRASWCPSRTTAERSSQRKCLCAGRRTEEGQQRTNTQGGAGSDRECMRRNESAKGMEGQGHECMQSVQHSLLTWCSQPKRYMLPPAASITNPPGSQPRGCIDVLCGRDTRRTNTDTRIG